jgi:hypothetical protein
LATLDKLPVWIALPFGLFVGAALGAVIMRPGAGIAAVAVSVVVLGIALGLGLSAPRPVPHADADADDAARPASETL